VFTRQRRTSNHNNLSLLIVVLSYCRMLLSLAQPSPLTSALGGSGVSTPLGAFRANAL